MVKGGVTQHRAVPSRDAELDREVTDRTDEEVREGKAQGPFDKEEVDNLLGKCWSPCRRVGLRQGAAPVAPSTTSLNLGTMDPRGCANIRRCPESFEGHQPGCGTEGCPRG